MVIVLNVSLSLKMCFHLHETIERIHLSIKEVVKNDHVA